MTAMDKALEGWRQVLGPARVTAAGEALERASRCTYNVSQRPSAVLEPENVEEVRACLAVARECRVPLYPISAGKNWGYGSGLPTIDGAVILFLGRMRRIVDYSEELAYVTVEPGVTFRMLAEFLRRQGSGLLPPQVGTRADASLVGNVMERGLGKGLYEELSARSCGYEAVLADGRVIRTGFSGLPGALAANLRGEGFGPSLQGLFVQSNLAVVTRLTLWLDPAPARHHRLWFTLPTLEGLHRLVDALRPVLLRHRDRIQAEAVNDYRVAAINGQYPYELFPDGRALPREALRCARWLGAVSCWADDDEELRWRRRLAAEALSSSGVAVVAEETVPEQEPGKLQDGMAATYWRKRTPAPLGKDPEGNPDAAPDPDRDGCGVMWHPPVLPMRGNVVGEAVDEIDGIMLRRGFEPFISLRMVGGRAIHAIVGLNYDREVEGADHRAAQCHRELREAMQARGLYPYRLGLIDMDDQAVMPDDNRHFLSAVKNVVDPEGILAPGRYIRDERV